MIEGDGEEGSSGEGLAAIGNGEDGSGNDPPSHRIGSSPTVGRIKSWYEGYGALAREEEDEEEDEEEEDEYEGYPGRHPPLSSKVRLKWRSSGALGSLLGRWSASSKSRETVVVTAATGSSPSAKILSTHPGGDEAFFLERGGGGGVLRKCHTLGTLSPLPPTHPRRRPTPMRAVNRLRRQNHHNNLVCSRCSSLLSMASSSRYSINTEGNYIQVGMIPCKLCLSSVPPSGTWTLQCGCTFCVQCMRAYVEFEIGQGAYEISCPDATCESQGVMSLREIENLVNSDVLEKHKRFRLNREVETDVGLAWCPSAGCETVCSVCTAPGGGSGVRVHCPTCSTDFCSLCRGPWHPEAPCPRSASSPIPGIAFDSELIKCCPMCAVPIEKDEGCAQMMCKRCKHVFCWYCLASLDDDFLLRHYDKGPCKNKLGHSRASVIWHRTQVIGIFAGFGILLLVASPLLLLAAPCIVCCKCRVCTGGGGPKLDSSDDDLAATTGAAMNKVESNGTGEEEPLDNNQPPGSSTAPS